ncbi:hypothetical protein K4K55_002338 [Colletotrichum sp. SAR 10_96]|nr:hypothetical protein K4K55_002338 [Colletotrichum sp. SAR 10_96]
MGWLTHLALAGLLGAASAASKHKLHDFDWDTITPTHKLSYHPCYSEYNCTRLIVPLDWLDASNPYNVTLAIIKRPAKVPDSDPAFGGTIFTNPGGPGGSGVELMLSEGYAHQETADSDRRKYEILSWDPRGVQFTTPRPDCYGEDSLARGTDMIQRLAVGPMSAGPDALRRQWARVQGYGKLCSQSAVNGSIIPFATTASTVRDMVHILDKIQELREGEAAAARGGGDGDAQKPLQAREEKGPLRLQYFGFSYGSLLGNTFASMYPGRVGRVIVDGIVDADDYVEGGWRTNLQDTEELLGQFYKTCFTAESKCALYRDSDTKWEDIRSRVSDLVKRLDEEPISVLDGKLTHILTGYDVVDAFKRPLYDPYRKFVPLAEKLSAAVDGNYTLLLNDAVESIPELDQACAAPNGTALPSTFGDGGQSILCGDAEDHTNLTLAAFSACQTHIKASIVSIIHNPSSDFSLGIIPSLNMKFAATLLTALAFVLPALGHPLEERDDVQTVHLTFHGGPASYDLAIPADGNTYPTNNNIAIDKIDANDYFAYSNCQFNTAGEKTLVQSINNQNGDQAIIVGPPQPIISVSCQGFCLGIYGDCYKNGQFVALCCNGFCAANKCRPWIAPN